MQDQGQFKEFNKKLSNYIQETSVISIVDQLKRNRQLRLNRRLGSSHSPTKSFGVDEGENYIDRNCNMIPHFKEYEAEKRRLIHELTAQQIERARRAREEQ